MWIHTNALDHDLHAALPDGVSLMGYVGFLEQAGSRTHERKVRVHLSGSSNRKSNSGRRGAGSYQAATYDEWGWFLSALFEADPTARAGVAGYEGRDDFHAKTEGKFKPTVVVQRSVIAEILTDLNGVCVFQFCQGPDKPFEDMETCRVCATVQTLRSI